MVSRCPASQEHYEVWPFWLFGPWHGRSTGGTPLQPASSRARSSVSRVLELHKVPKVAEDGEDV